MNTTHYGQRMTTMQLCITGKQIVNDISKKKEVGDTHRKEQRDKFTQTTSVTYSPQNTSRAPLEFQTGSTQLRLPVPLWELPHSSRLQVDAIDLAVTDDRTEHKCA